MKLSPFSKIDNDALQVDDHANIVSIIAIFVAIVQFFLTILIRVAESADPVEVYLRNFSSIIALLLLADFFSKFDMLQEIEIWTRYMKSFKIISLLLAIASLAKVAIAALYIIKYFPKGNLVFLFYLGEIAVWGAVCYFAVVHFKKACVMERFAKENERKEIQPENDTDDK